MLEIPVDHKKVVGLTQNIGQTYKDSMIDLFIFGSECLEQRMSGRDIETLECLDKQGKRTPLGKKIYKDLHHIIIAIGRLEEYSKRRVEWTPTSAEENKNIIDKWYSLAILAHGIGYRWKKHKKALLELIDKKDLILKDLRAIPLNPDPMVIMRIIEWEFYGGEDGTGVGYDFYPTGNYKKLGVIRTAIRKVAKADKGIQDFARKFRDKGCIEHHIGVRDTNRFSRDFNIYPY